MKSRMLCLLPLLVWVFLSGSAFAQVEKQPLDFTKAVITKAISLMPEDIKAKLTPVEKNLLTGTKLLGADVVYYVAKGEGSGPKDLAEQFRLVRKATKDKTTFPTVAKKLGNLAACVISLSQPYHTDEAAFKEPAHAAFEKELDAAIATLKAESDGFQKVDNPSDFATKLAKSANELLRRKNSKDPEESTDIKGPVFALAVNSVVDCWWTILAGDSPANVNTATAESGSFIGNLRSLKFHLTTCKYPPAEKNRTYFKTRDKALEEGYVPCKVCKP